MHLLCRHRAHSPKRFNRKTGYEIKRLFRMNSAQAIRFSIVWGDLRQKLIIRDTGWRDQIQFLTDAELYFLCYVYRQRDSFFILRHIQKSLIQRKRFDYISIFMKDFMYLTGDGLINIHSTMYKYQLRTKFLCLLWSHSWADAIAPGFITRRRYHSPLLGMPHCQRFATKFRIIALFYRGVESVHIDMYDLTLRHYLRLSEQTYYNFPNK